MPTPTSASETTIRFSAPRHGHVLVTTTTDAGPVLVLGAVLLVALVAGCWVWVTAVRSWAGAPDRTVGSLVLVIGTPGPRLEPGRLGPAEERGGDPVGVLGAGQHHHLDLGPAGRPVVHDGPRDGGPVGVGTVLYALGIGPAVQVAFRVFGQTPVRRPVEAPA